MKRSSRSVQRYAKLTTAFWGLFGGAAGAFIGHLESPGWAVFGAVLWSLGAAWVARPSEPYATWKR